MNGNETGGLRRCLAAILAGTALICLNAFALDEDFAAAEAVFHRAEAGEERATDEAVACFEQLTAAAGPKAPLMAAYLGAAQAMQGRDAWMPMTKLRAAERGLATIDRALRDLTPDSDAISQRGAPMGLETKLVAISTFVSLPDGFHRLDRARLLLREALTSPAFAAAPPGLRAAFHRQAALVAARDGRRGEEAAQWRHVLAADPAGAFAAAARQRLSEIGS